MEIQANIADKENMDMANVDSPKVYTIESMKIASKIKIFLLFLIQFVRLRLLSVLRMIKELQQQHGKWKQPVSTSYKANEC